MLHVGIESGGLRKSDTLHFALWFFYYLCRMSRIFFLAWSAGGGSSCTPISKLTFYFFFYPSLTKGTRVFILPRKLGPSSLLTAVSPSPTLIASCRRRRVFRRCSVSHAYLISGGELLDYILGIKSSMGEGFSYPHRRPGPCIFNGGWRHRRVCGVALSGHARHLRFRRRGFGGKTQWNLHRSAHGLILVIPS